MVASIAAITEQHLLSITLASTDSATGIQSGLAPSDAVLQDGQVKEYLGKVCGDHQGFFPSLL